MGDMNYFICIRTSKSYIESDVLIKSYILVNHDNTKTEIFFENGENIISNNNTLLNSVNWDIKLLINEEQYFIIKENNLIFRNLKSVLNQLKLIEHLI
jgi:hypothetical protein